MVLYTNDFIIFTPERCLKLDQFLSVLKGMLFVYGCESYDLYSIRLCAHVRFFQRINPTQNPLQVSKVISAADFHFAVTVVTIDMD